MTALMLRRRSLIACTGSFSIPSFTGTSAVVGDAKKGYMKLLSSGALTFTGPGVVDLFLVNGGNGGSCGGAKGSSPFLSAAGGGGYTKTVFNLPVMPRDYSIIVGNGGAGGPYMDKSGNERLWGSPGETSSAFGYSPRPQVGGDQLGNGGSGGGGCQVYAERGGAGGADGANGRPGVMSSSRAGVGQGSTTRAFGDASFELYSGGGGGGGIRYDSRDIVLAGEFGGAGGGGQGGDGGRGQSDGFQGAPNTGGGGGQGSNWWDHPAFFAGGAGGSGIIIIRWGY